MKFLIDNQLPLSLARFLAAAGNDCQHVLDLGLAQSPDAEIWRYVTERAITLLTKDEDFFHLATRPGATGQVVWVRLGNCRSQRSWQPLIKPGREFRPVCRRATASWSFAESVLERRLSLDSRG